MSESSRWPLLDHLRALITVLVVLHHTLLAWHPYAPPPFGLFGAPPTLWQAFPVVDPVRAAGTEWLVGFNDTFFMALMFLIGGWFVVAQVRRDGAAGYVRSRLLRLGLPFLFSVLLLSPLAYLPAWLQRTGSWDLVAYAQVWWQLPHWPPGPAWFLAVLLALGLLASLLLSIWRHLPDRLEVLGHQLLARTWRLPVVLSLLALATYLPLAYAAGPLDWWTYGPFTVQAARALLYPAFFGVGMLLGAARPTERSWLSRDAAFVRHWWGWLVLALLVFWCNSRWSGQVYTAWFSGAVPPPWLVCAAHASYAVACALLSLAVLAAVARWAWRSTAVWCSLSSNAYAIYLLHYPLVTWLQYALLGATGWPAWAKVSLAVPVALGLSWSLAALVRRMPAVARVV